MNCYFSLEHLWFVRHPQDPQHKILVFLSPCASDMMLSFLCKSFKGGELKEMTSLYRNIFQQIYNSHSDPTLYSHFEIHPFRLCFSPGDLCPFPVSQIPWRSFSLDDFHFFLDRLQVSGFSSLVESFSTFDLIRQLRRLLCCDTWEVFLSEVSIVYFPKKRSNRALFDLIQSVMSRSVTCPAPSLCQNNNKYEQPISLRPVAVTFNFSCPLLAKSESREVPELIPRFLLEGRRVGADDQVSIFGFLPSIDSLPLFAFSSSGQEESLTLQDTLISSFSSIRHFLSRLSFPAENEFSFSPTVWGPDEWDKPHWAHETMAREHLFHTCLLSTLTKKSKIIETKPPRHPSKTTSSVLMSQLRKKFPRRGVPRRTVKPQFVPSAAAADASSDNPVGFSLEDLGLTNLLLLSSPSSLTQIE